MKWNRKLRIDRRLWLLVSTVLFILEWFMPFGFGSGKMGDEPIGTLWLALFSGEYINVQDLAFALIVFTSVFAVIAFTVGAVLHFLILLAIDVCRGKGFLQGRATNLRIKGYVPKS